MTRFVRAHLAVTLVATVVTAWFSYGYFHIDEYFQVVELARWKLGQVEAWALPWEHTSRMRPWLQPALYVAIARLSRASDPFLLAFLFRVVTGLACVASLALFLRTTLPWFASERERRIFVRVATLLGFLPFLFVRTSSETLSMAAFTAGLAIALEGSSPTGPPLTARSARLLDAGVLLGLAFESRFQTAILTLGLVAWMRFRARASVAQLACLASGFAAAIGFGALVDRWGYGVFTFPPWTYLQANLVEGASLFYGSDPPLAYLVSLPANVFAPVVVALLVCAVVAWWRHPRHAITWTTLPFFVVHNLLAHKEERFLFPTAILATAFVPMALSASPWLSARTGIAKLLAAWSTAMMLLLAFYPLGWHHHVRFQRYVHDELGGELRAFALPDFDLGLPAFHPRVYDVEKQDEEVLAQRIGERPWLVADTPLLAREAPSLARCTTLVWSELPVFQSAGHMEQVMRWVDAYNARRISPLRPIRFRSLYRTDPSCANVPPAHSQVFFAEPGPKLLGAPE